MLLEESITKELEVYRAELINHSLYKKIKSIEDLNLFMEYHVFAVWDFMSLLKSLQINLTCVEVPWFPKGDANTRFLINEIVAGEESDVDEKGIRKSHFELYLEAMKQSAASTQEIDVFTEALKNNSNLNLAFKTAGLNKAITDFVSFTFEIIESKKEYLQAAVFTYGREDLIPAMFLSIVKDLYHNFPNQISKFKYYLERHIEVDGDHHSHLALEMTQSLCKTPQHWVEAMAASKKALILRKKLWDAIEVAL
ncbi:DUF3050 domain-containing protein [Pedobacter alpinus]|uniref:DUF3050 domain-containing protein n=1 Tax=Pedobacter alpinus TaxID=1590643 RepID=A0ABW5TU52_9SPHI